MDLYEVLGVSKEATKEDIVKAFRQKAQHLHPDKNGGKNSAEFVELVKAYETLVNTRSRKIYDETGIYDSENASLNAQQRELKHMASKIVRKAFNELLISTKYEYKDELDKNEPKINLISFLLSDLRTQKSELERQLLAIEKYRLDIIMKRLPKRIIKKGGGSNDLVVFIQAEVKELIASFKQSQKLLEQVNSRIEILSQYQDTFREQIKERKPWQLLTDITDRLPYRQDSSRK